MRRFLVAAAVAAIYVVGFAMVAVMAVQLVESWGAEPWKLLLTLPVLALLALGALEHYLGD